MQADRQPTTRLPARSGRHQKSAIALGRSIGENKMPSAVLGFLRPINVERARELKVDAEAKERGQKQSSRTE